MNEQHEPETVNRDRWCVNCQRNVFAQKAGTSAIMLVVATVLMIVLGGIVGIGIAVSLETASGSTSSFVAPMAIGALLGLLAAWIAIGADERRCAICKSSNLQYAH